MSATTHTAASGLVFMLSEIPSLILCYDRSFWRSTIAVNLPPHYPSIMYILLWFTGYFAERSVRLWIDFLSSSSLLFSIFFFFLQIIEMLKSTACLKGVIIYSLKAQSFWWVFHTSFLRKKNWRSDSQPLCGLVALLCCLFFFTLNFSSKRFLGGLSKDLVS